MNYEQFVDSLKNTEAPQLSSPLLLALWHDGRGDWDAAHRIAQDIESADGAWIHAFLHKREGDLSNAAYWYRRAGRAPSTLPPEDEWKEIVIDLLNR